MTRRFLAFALQPLILLTWSCRDPDADLLPPVGYAETIATLGGNERVRFGEGWYDIEFGTDGQSWRWMGRQGSIRLRSSEAEMKLRLEGWVALELLPRPPTLRLSFNGEELDRFVAPPGRFLREYDIPAGSQGSDPESVLVIESSAVATPPQDPRELGYSLVDFTWEAQ